MKVKWAHFDSNGPTLQLEGEVLAAELNGANRFVLLVRNDLRGGMLCTVEASDVCVVPELPPGMSYSSGLAGREVSDFLLSQELVLSADPVHQLVEYAEGLLEERKERDEAVKGLEDSYVAAMTKIQEQIEKIQELEGTLAEAQANGKKKRKNLLDKGEGEEK